MQASLKRWSQPMGQEPVRIELVLQQAAGPRLQSGRARRGGSEPGQHVGHDLHHGQAKKGREGQQGTQGRHHTPLRSLPGS